MLALSKMPHRHVVALLANRVDFPEQRTNARTQYPVTDTIRKRVRRVGAVREEFGLNPQCYQNELSESLSGLALLVARAVDDLDVLCHVTFGCVTPVGDRVT